MPVSPPVTNPDDSVPRSGSIGPGRSISIEDTKPESVGFQYPAFAPSSWSVISYDTDAYLLSTGPLLVRCDATTANMTVTLPDSGSTPMVMFHIVKVDSGANTVTIAVQSSDTWYGATAGQTLASQWKSVTLLSVNDSNDRANVTSIPSAIGWHVIATT